MCSTTFVTDNQGNCVDIVDQTSPAVIAYDPTTGLFDLSPFADIVHGGWLGPDYFEKCLGSADIIAVTWTFTGGDANHDQYDDIVYDEQYANTRWGFVTSGSVFLDFDGPFDIQSVFVHENGRALGLGHTGGPTRSALAGRSEASCRSIWPPFVSSTAGSIDRSRRCGA